MSQGSNGAWKSDRFAAKLLGHTLLAAFMTQIGKDLFEIDFLEWLVVRQIPAVMYQLQTIH